MNRKLAFTAAAMLAAFAFTVQTADAGSRRVDKRVTIVGIGVGAASTAAFFAINDWRWKDWDATLPRWGAWAATTIGCAAVAPMIATVVVNRPLTQREGHVLTGGCVVPIVGGWIVNKAYDAHPSWEAGAKAPAMKKMAAKKKKM